MEPQNSQPDYNRIYMQVYQERQQQQEARDEADRSLPALRVLMVKLVRYLDEDLMYISGELVQAMGLDLMDEFDLDICRALLLWQLQEFLGRAQIDRDDEYTGWTQAHQITSRHAESWFSVSPLTDGTLVAIGKDGKIEEVKA